MTNQSIRIVIAHDHEIFRDGFKLLLKNQTEALLCGEAANGQELVELVEQVLPDIAFVDIQMPVMSGIEACWQVKEAHPATAVIAFSSFNDDHLIVDMIQAGANGYLLKNTTKDELRKALQAVREGRAYYTPEISERMSRLRDENRLLPGRMSPVIKFSERELKIIQLICQQLTNKEIAAVLGVSIRTVESHRERIQEKIGAKNVAGIVLYAVQHRLFDL